MLLIGLLSFATGTMIGQATNASGSIQGTVTDPTGAVITSARVTITNTATGQKILRTTSAAGTYSSGALQPGDYSVRVEAAGFQTVALTVTVQVGVNAGGNVKMAVGNAAEVVEVTGSQVLVNTEQGTVQGVLTSHQIENLPVNGRNFLDLAQLEPGVQIQDGGNFDPTKNGFSSVSFGGRAGRTARITMDGIDISDETVGTTTQNVASSTIQEFQLSQSSLDLSTELTSSGAVNVVTKSGTNTMHGDAFYNLRDKRAGMANFPGGQDNYFQRNQFGGSLGGAFVKDKLFWFADAERVKQATLVPIDPSGTPFASIPRGYNSPFKDTTMMGKLDWNAPRNMKLFYRFNYNWNGDIAAYGTTYQPFANRNNTPSQGAGMDWSTGKFTHSFRYGWLKFQNHIADAVLGGGVFNPAGTTPLAIRIGGASSQFRFGPSRLAPQATFQANNQYKYDGSWLKGSHIVRYGVDFNRIRGGGFASFYNWPEARSSTFGPSGVAFADKGPFPGGSANPLNYPLNTIVAGNGQGFSTEFPAFGYPAGGQRDNRFAFYVGDTWKIKPTLTLTYGVRYSRDTGRQDSDMAPITCDQIPASTLAELSPSQIPCKGSTLLFDQFGGSYGGRVNQPNANFGPQVGFAWDPTGKGKTSIRGGGGLYYENAIFNNVLFDRPVRLTKGLFYNSVALTKGGSQLVLPTGTVTTFPYNGQQVSIASLFNQPIGSVMGQVVALGNYYRSETAKGGAAANPAFIGAGLTQTGSAIGPNYKTPQSWQMNLGIQHELAKGTVVSADFLRNVGLHYLLGIDTNHVGDVRYLNKAAAQGAIADTLAQYDVSSINGAIQAGATMEDFAYNGLGSGWDVCGGLPASLCGVNGLAFGGINPLVGGNNMFLPVGRSVYTALQLKLLSQWDHHLPRFMTRMSTQVAYSRSRFNTQTGDQDFLNSSFDWANPGRYFGPSSLDRSHQLAFGTVMEFKHGPQISMVGHVNSPLSITPILVSGGNGGEIYYTDITGDGTTSDAIGQIGDYGRKYNGSGFAKELSQYNSQYAGKLTPAAQALVSAGLFTQSQLTALGAVAQTASTAGPFAPLGWLKTIDLKLAYPIHVRERVTISPSVGVFNLFNFVNHDISTAPGQILSGATDGTANSVSNATYFTTPRAGLGTGVNTIGAPRQMEFSLRLTF
jgi:hypothetical protein